MVEPNESQTSGSIPMNLELKRTKVQKKKKKPQLATVTHVVNLNVALAFVHILFYNLMCVTASANAHL